MNEAIGLLSKELVQVALLGVSVAGTILGRSARVKVAQRFRNTESTPIEAVYKFPLPEGAGVCGFTVRLADRTLTHTVEDRDRAFDLYDRALAEGHGAFLLDEERPNIFTLSVGSLLPGSEAVIELDYVQLLDAKREEVRFTLPTTISPRYLPAHLPEDDGIPESEKIIPAYSATVPYGLSLSLDIGGAAMLKSVESPSHPIRVEMNGEMYRVQLTNDSGRMDRDFILTMIYNESFLSRAFAAPREGETFIQVDLNPESVFESHSRNEPKSREEVVFLLDCSGSMTGSSIEEAKRALQICLRAMDGASCFNLYRFGSTFESLFQQSQPYSEAKLKKALDYLDRADADLGGTEILEPLKDIVRTRPDDRRSIVVITDGQVGNEDEVMDLIRNNSDHTRVFAIGIGAGPNDFLVKGLSRAGRGVSEFIFPGERIEPKVIRIFSKIGQPALTGLKIAGIPGDMAPVEASLLPGETTTLFLRAPSALDPPASIRINGIINEKPVTLSIPFSPSRPQDLPVPTLWAREKIRDLEEGDSFGLGSQQKSRTAASRKKMIVELSKQFELLSRFTSFVAVEEREEKDRTTGEIVLRKIPLPVTWGWHGDIDAVSSHPEMVCHKIPSLELDIYARQSREEFPSSAAEKIVESRRPVRAYSAKAPGLDKDAVLLDILLDQRAEGGFDLTPSVAKALKIKLSDLKKASKKLTMKGPGDPFLLVSTAVLLRVLEVHLLDLKDLWHTIVWENTVEKSRRWLADAVRDLDPAIDGEPLVTWAEHFVAKNMKG